MLIPIKQDSHSLYILEEVSRWLIRLEAHLEIDTPSHWDLTDWGVDLEGDDCVLGACLSLLRAYNPMHFYGEHERIHKRDYFRLTVHTSSPEREIDELIQRVDPSLLLIIHLQEHLFMEHDLVGIIDGYF